MVVFGHDLLYSGKVLVIVKSGCALAKWLCSCKVVVFGQTGCIREKVVVFGKIGCIRAKLVVLEQNLLSWSKSG